MLESVKGKIGVARGDRSVEESWEGVDLAMKKVLRDDDSVWQNWSNSLNNCWVPCT
jgi:hypothetical protein